MSARYDAPIPFTKPKSVDEEAHHIVSDILVTGLVVFVVLTCVVLAFGLGQ
jgi:hypothetical protein